MKLAFYMDVHISAAVTRGLRRRSVDVLTAQEDHQGQTDDPQLLDRATSLGRVLVTHDPDLVAESIRRQQIGERFGGVIYIPQRAVRIGQFIEDLKLISDFYQAEEFMNRLEYLPLR